MLPDRRLSSKNFDQVPANCPDGILGGAGVGHNDHSAIQPVPNDHLREERARRAGVSAHGLAAGLRDAPAHAEPAVRRVKPAERLG